MAAPDIAIRTPAEFTCVGSSRNSVRPPAITTSVADSMARRSAALHPGRTIASLLWKTTIGERDILAPALHADAYPRLCASSITVTSGQTDRSHVTDSSLEPLSTTMISALDTL